MDEIADVSDRNKNTSLMKCSSIFRDSFHQCGTGLYKIFLHNRELRRSSLLWRGVGEKRLPGRFALAKALLSLVFFRRLSFLSDNGKNIFRPRPRKMIHDLLLSQQKTETINIDMNSGLFL